jgi:hypothetical protein
MENPMKTEQAKQKINRRGTWSATNNSRAVNSKYNPLLGKPVDARKE